MATKTWEINTLERELADGYVKNAVYRVNGADGTYTFRATGQVFLPKPDTLKAYGDLTEAEVLGWVKARIEELAAADDSNPTVAAIETAVENGVNEQKTPTTGTGKPW